MSGSLQIARRSVGDSGHSQNPRQLTTYYLWYFADVAAYLLKKEVEKIKL